ncbi:MAG: pyridoxamine 5'-phosphate oxidase family protein [Bacteroidaceae bacterium]|nr:pyridoxamine 5'-phosphate oxidase family protein [Bacteroidaceae bacterium]
MNEVLAYLKECGAFYLATCEGDQPRVRPFGAVEIIDGRLYIITGKVKNVFKQMDANAKFEICAMKASGAEWMRLCGKVVNDDSLSVKERFLELNPELKSMYKADDGNMAVLYVTDATATFYSFTEAPKEISF